MSRQDSEAQLAIIKPIGRQVSGDQLAIFKLMSRQVSCGSAGDYEADEQAGVARLRWRVSGR